MMMVVVIHQVPSTYDRIVLTFVLEILLLMLTNSCSENRKLFNHENAVFALSISVLTSASKPPYL